MKAGQPPRLAPIAQQAGITADLQSWDKSPSHPGHQAGLASLQVMPTPAQAISSLLCALRLLPMTSPSVIMGSRRLQASSPSGRPRELWTLDLGLPVAIFGAMASTGTILGTASTETKPCPIKIVVLSAPKSRESLHCAPALHPPSPLLAPA